jgi:hypothetical protein
MSVTYWNGRAMVQRLGVFNTPVRSDNRLSYSNSAYAHMHVNPKVECKLDLLWKNKGRGMRGSLQSDYLVPMVSPSTLNGQTSSVN